MLVQTAKVLFHNGVSEQPPETILDGQVVEMINATPTVNMGLKKRNPISVKATLAGKTLSRNASRYNYIRDDSESYIFLFDEHDNYIINTTTLEDATIVYADAQSREYLKGNNFAFTTVKDTTFVVNRDVLPQIKEGVPVPDLVPYHEVNVKISVSNIIYYKTTGFVLYCNLPILDDTSEDDFINNTFAGNRIPLNSGGASIDDTKNLNRKLISLLKTKGFNGYKDGDIISYGSAWIKFKGIAPDGKSIYRHPRPDIDNCQCPGYVPAGAGFEYDALKMFNANISIINTVIENNPNKKILDYYGYIWVNLSEPNYGYTYSVEIKDEVSGELLASASTSGIKTTKDVATTLTAQINASSDIRAVSIGSQIRFYSISKRPLKIICSDSYGDTAMYGWTTKVASMNDLPSNMNFQNATVKISGSATSSYDDYYVSYFDENWKEWHGFGAMQTPDKSTMPHKIERIDNNSFRVSPIDWDSVYVGDSETNPRPYIFNNEAIQDIFFYKNRLVLVSATGVTMSETNSYYNLFRTTTLSVLDSDPIFVRVDSTDVVNIKYANLISGSVLLFAENAQYKLAGGNILSPNNIQIAKISSYDNDLSIRPVAVNDKLYFPVSNGDYSCITEYYPAKDENSFYALDITAHCQHYIKGKVISISANSTHNMLFVVTDDEENSIYVYKYFEQSSTRVQSAWFKWDFLIKPYIAIVNDDNLCMLHANPTLMECNSNWIFNNSTWDDFKIWDDTQLWGVGENERKDIVLVNDNIHYSEMQISNVPTDAVMADTYQDGKQYLYNMFIELPIWKAKRGDYVIDGILKLQSVSISGDNDRYVNINVENTKTGATYGIDRSRTFLKETLVMGDADDVKLTLQSSNTKNVAIHSLTLKGNLSTHYQPMARRTY